jgi:hypothetical protein
MARPANYNISLALLGGAAAALIALSSPAVARGGTELKCGCLAMREAYDAKINPRYRSVRNARPAAHSHIANCIWRRGCS